MYQTNTYLFHFVSTKIILQRTCYNWNWLAYTSINHFFSNFSPNLFLINICKFYWNNRLFINYKVLTIHFVYSISMFIEIIHLKILNTWDYLRKFKIPFEILSIPDCTIKFLHERWYIKLIFKHLIRNTDFAEKSSLFIHVK